MTGLYADATRAGGVLATRITAKSFAATDTPQAKVVFADHQNKPDVGMAIARQWLDRDGADLIVEVINSAVALVVNEDVR